MVFKALSEAGFARIAQLPTSGQRPQALLFSPDGSHIAYTTLSNEIVVRSVEGEIVFQMRRSVIGKVAWSPSGTSIAFLSGRNLHVYSLEKRAEHQIRLGASTFDWIREDAVVCDDGLGGVVIADVASQQMRRVRVGDTSAQLVEAISRPACDLLFLFYRSRFEVLKLTTLENVASAAFGEREGFSVSHSRALRSATVSSTGRLAAVVQESDPRTINVFGGENFGHIAVLERATTAGFLRLTFSADGSVLCASAQDGTVSFWDTKSWRATGTFANPSFPVDIVFDQSSPRFATVRQNSNFIDICSLTEGVLSPTFSQDQVQYISARVVLLGDSGVGKTGLGWRLTHDEFKEHESTHGRQFWRIPRLSRTLADGVECDAVLWDLAGQPDYRLTHSLHLEGVDVGLLVFDASNRTTPLAGVEYWLHHLKHSGKPSHLFLIGARNDRGTPTLTHSQLQDFCVRAGIDGFLSTSAKTGDGVEKLLETLDVALDWNSRPRTTGSRAFTALRDFVVRTKVTEDSRCLVDVNTFAELAGRSGVASGPLTNVLPHLESHGYVTLIKDVRGRDWVLKTPQLLDNLAASIVLEARKEPAGLGALDEARLFEGGYALPELESLESLEREVVLHAAMSRFFRAAVCFREMHGNKTLVIFPSLINEQPSEDMFPSGLSDDTCYILTGAVEQVYPSLTVLLGYTNIFARAAQWRDQAQYRFETGEVCGFKQQVAEDGAVTITLRYDANTTSATRELFQCIVERLLLKHDVEITRCPPVDCSKCGVRQDRGSVLRLMERKREHGFCGDCGEEFDVPQSQLVSRASAPQLDESVEAAASDAMSRSLFEQELTKIKAILARRPPELRRRRTCYVVYPWGDRALETWVERLVLDLRHGGMEVLLDRHNNLPGDSLVRFTERIMEVDKVVVVGTPDTRAKYNRKNTDPVVRAELEMVAQRASEPERFQRSVIPLLRSGTKSTSLIPMLESLIAVDYRDDQRYFANTIQLIRALHDLRHDEYTALPGDQG